MQFTFFYQYVHSEYMFYVSMNFAAHTILILFTGIYATIE